MKKKDNQTKLLTTEEVNHQWFVLDASGKTLGRFAAEIAKIYAVNIALISHPISTAATALLLSMLKK